MASSRIAARKRLASGYRLASHGAKTADSLLLTHSQAAICLESSLDNPTRRDWLAVVHRPNSVKRWSGIRGQ